MYHSSRSSASLGGSSRGSGSSGRKSVTSETSLSYIRAVLGCSIGRRIARQFRLAVRTVRPWCARCVDRPPFQGMMFVATVYVLFVSDIRLCMTAQPADAWFDGFTIAAFFLFLFELVTSCLGKPDYFLSFFFYLDVFATLSLLMDITFIYLLFVSQFAGGPVTRAGRMSRMGMRAGRVIRVLRLIRLIRIIKLYKHVLDLWNHLRGRPDLVTKPGETVDGEEIYAESRVGMKLSQMTTQKVIMLILFMLLIVPWLSVEPYFLNVPTSAGLGADVVYRAWTDCHRNASAIACSLFEQQLALYMGFHRSGQGANCRSDWSRAWNSECKLNLGWVGLLDGTPETSFNVDDSLTFGQHWEYLFGDTLASAGISEEAEQALEGKGLIRCSGTSSIDPGSFVSLLDAWSCPGELRFEETKFVAPSLVGVDEEAYLVFVFDLRPHVLRTSFYSILQTCFICMMLGVGAMVFSHNANVLVLQPIERMISKVQKIRENPLYAMRLGDEAYREKQELEDAAGGPESWWACLQRVAKRNRRDLKAQSMETMILENAITKLGKLLALGFGEAGSEIIGKNMDDDTATVNAMILGNKVEAIFGFCRIRNFADTTEVLQDKVMVFVNAVAEIVHHVVDTWHGAANRNIGDAFLIVWRMREKTPKTKVGDMSVMSFVQVVSAINRSAVLREYRENPALLARLRNCHPEGYRVQMGFGLHYGWAIEGAIGSEFKIDASYLSPHVNMASRLEAETREYGVRVLMSEPLVALCSPELRENLRTIDNVTLQGGTSTPISLHTLDLRVDNLKTDFLLTKNPRNLWEARMLRERDKAEKLEDTFEVHKAFQHDVYFQIMRQDIPLAFFETFAKGYLNYEAGEWDVARSVLEATRDFFPELVPDGPSVALLKYMAQYHFDSSLVEAAPGKPLGWPGYRELTGT